MSTRMQRAMMMMTDAESDDDDDDDAHQQDGLALVQTKSWPLGFHHCVQGLRSFVMLILDGKHPLAPYVSNAYLRGIPLRAFNRWARPWQSVESVVFVVDVMMERRRCPRRRGRWWL